MSIEKLRKQDAKDMVAYFENRKKEAENPYCPFGTSMKEPWDEADPYTIQKVIEAIKRWGAI